jgi:hypothetical protein
MMVLGSALRHSKVDQKLNMLNIAGRSNLKNGFELADFGCELRYPLWCL